MTKVLVVGTRNPKKRVEILEILQGMPLDVQDLTDKPDVPEVIEDGTTFIDNAKKKAVEVSQYLNQWVIGEDSGLVVPGLNGRPGVYSARYAGPECDDEANNDKLLAELAPLPEDRRAAYYICTVALANPKGEVIATVEGRCHGKIIHERRGTGGFGYDPLFLIPEYHKTFGELNAVVKHALSHRGRALAKLRPALYQLIQS